MPTSPSDAAFLQRFLDGVEWRFAKTYVASYPHEYTLKRLCPPEGHARVIALIEEHGVVEPFYTARRKYLHFGERKLWHMGDPASPDPGQHPDVINRTWLDVTRYRGEARRLGYEGEALERLVALWPVLLERARGAAAGGHGGGLLAALGKCA
jgi:hypothetical protein